MTPRLELLKGVRRRRSTRRSPDWSCDFREGGRKDKVGVAAGQLFAGRKTDNWNDGGVHTLVADLNGLIYVCAVMGKGERHRLAPYPR